MRLEPLTGDKLPAVRELIATGVLELYGDLDFLPKTLPALLEYYRKTGYLSDLDDFESTYASSQGVFYVLLVGETVIGCGGLRRLSEFDAELTRLWLSQERRGQGCGRRLLDALLHHAEALGYARIFLDTSTRCGDALRLFRRNGFRDCDPYKQSIGDVFLCREMKGAANNTSAA